jgi:hypothetical protein
MKPEEIIRRQAVLKTHRSAIEAIWNDVEKYIMPLRIGNMYQPQVQETSIVYEREEIYDSTAIWAAQKFASNIHGTVTNPVFKWFDYHVQGQEAAPRPGGFGVAPRVHGHRLRRAV